MKADNESMTEKNRKDLIQGVYDVLIRIPHLDYADKLLAATPLEQQNLIFNGYQAFPKPIAYGFESKVRKEFGAIRSPFYGELYDESQYESDRFHQALLDFPDDLAEQVGRGKCFMSDRRNL